MSLVIAQGNFMGTVMDSIMDAVRDFKTRNAVDDVYLLNAVEPDDRRRFTQGYSFESAWILSKPFELVSGENNKEVRRYLLAIGEHDSKMLRYIAVVLEVGIRKQRLYGANAKFLASRYSKNLPIEQEIKQFELAKALVM